MQLAGRKMLDRIVSTCMGGRTVRINVMQPLTVNFVTDDQLSVDERSNAILANYKKVLHDHFQCILILLTE